ncbi:MAG: hypothetical protein ABWZ16_01825 [Microbacterium sp.]
MTPTSALTAPTVWAPPSGVRIRGTLALVAGGGESPRVYERFGRRISTDGYTVAAFETGSAASALQWLTGHADTPRVLAGSDIGAAAVLALAADGAAVDGVIVAGLPVAAADDTHADASLRTACPVHLGVLESEGAQATTPVQTIDVPDAGTLGRISVPVLAIHGGADPIVPFELAQDTLRSIDVIEVVETVDGLHDALNDLSHRSVAATIVLWLERLRGAGVRTPVVRTSSLNGDIS